MPILKKFVRYKLKKSKNYNCDIIPIDDRAVNNQIFEKYEEIHEDKLLDRYGTYSTATAET